MALYIVFWAGYPSTHHFHSEFNRNRRAWRGNRVSHLQAQTKPTSNHKSQNLNISTRFFLYTCLVHQSNYEDYVRGLYYVCVGAVVTMMPRMRTIASSFYVHVERRCCWMHLQLIVGGRMKLHDEWLQNIVKRGLIIYMVKYSSSHWERVYIRKHWKKAVFGVENVSKHDRALKENVCIIQVRSKISISR